MKRIGFADSERAVNGQVAVQILDLCKAYLSAVDSGQR